MRVGPKPSKSGPKLLAATTSRVGIRLALGSRVYNTGFERCAILGGGAK